MAIYLVQHGKCLTKAVDPEKGLSEQGAEEVLRIAQVAAGYGIEVSEIRHSGKKRALQTAEIITQAINLEKGVRKEQGINPLDDVVAYARKLDFASHGMIVGHLPFLEKLIAYLIIGQPEPAVFQMQNSGIVCLDLDGRTLRPIIKWTLMPQIG